LPWHGQQIRWEAPLAADLADFTEGKTVAETPGVVIWSRHD